MAIAAQLEEATGATGKAREHRRTLRLEAQGVTGSGSATNVLVHNVSATGLLLESPVTLAVGEAIEIELPQAGATSARVVWASGVLHGCQFDAPITPAALSAAELRSAVGGEVEIGAPTETVLDESFGVRLQRLRKKRGLSLAQVADRLGVSKPTVWAWERGKARPVERRIDALAEALGLPSADLLPRRDASALTDLLARSREQIAAAAGTRPEKVRIFVEL